MRGIFVSCVLWPDRRRPRSEEKLRGGWGGSIGVRRTPAPLYDRRAAAVVARADTANGNNSNTNDLVHSEPRERQQEDVRCNLVLELSAVVKPSALAWGIYIVYFTPSVRGAGVAAH